MRPRTAEGRDRPASLAGLVPVQLATSKISKIDFGILWVKLSYTMFYQDFKQVKV